MALTDVQLANPEGPQQCVPVANQNDWMAICYDPTTADTANLLKPSDISRAGQRRVVVGRRGTSVEVCLRYETGQAVTTALVIQLVGIDANGVPQLLSDANGTKNWPFDDASTTDMKGAAGNSYTPEIEVDLRNNATFMVLVVTAMVGGGTVDTSGSALGPQIMAKLK